MNDELMLRYGDPIDNFIDFSHQHKKDIKQDTEERCIV